MSVSPPYPTTSWKQKSSAEWQSLLHQWRAIRRSSSCYDQYAADPIAYSHEVLQVSWWHKQQEIALALLEHKRVFVKAGNGPGKSFLAASLVNWFFDSFRPGLCLTTAPTQAQVQDVLWREVRSLRQGRPGLQPKAPRMEDAADHFAVGYTASTPDAFQGRHAEPLFLIFDEGTGIDGAFWDAGEGMQPTFWLVLLNPTDTSSRAYEEEQKASWHVITLNAFEHPNITAALASEPIPYPQTSLKIEWVRDRIAEWCTPIGKTDARSQDFEFEGVWYRPGPLFEARVLGRWPTAGSTSVWTEAMWQAALKAQEIDESVPLVLGCDVARFGDDFTSILVRRGACALHHETHNGWSTEQTAGRLKQICREYSARGESPERIAVHVDDDGVGGGVLDQKGEFNFLGVSGAHRARQEKDYPNKRSESWFVGAEMADEGRMDLSRLSPQSLSLIRRQVMSPTWKLDSQGRRVVEPKADTKKRIGRSPDDADALNLAYNPDSKRKIRAY